MNPALMLPFLLTALSTAAGAFDSRSERSFEVERFTLYNEGITDHEKESEEEDEPDCD